MNIREYILSGIIESYVLGVASDRERREFEQACKKYPELLEARILFEKALEEKAFSNAVPPSAELKTRIMEALQQEAALNAAARIVSLPASNRPVRKLGTMRWAIAASVAVLLAAGTLLYNLYTRNRQLEDEVARREAIDKAENRAQMIEETLSPSENRIIQASDMQPGEMVQAKINVYGDTTSNNIYLVIQDLRALPQHQHYELWAAKKGSYKSLGLFNAPANDNKLIMRMNNVKDADSFAITIRKDQ